MGSPDRIIGSVEKVRSRNPDSGWGVIEVLVGEETVLAVGSVSHVDEGLRFDAEGEWSNHAVYGRQFRVQTVRVYPPVTATGIERFLRSGAVEGIGPVFAKSIVDRFGDETLEVIEKYSWKLERLKGVGPKRIRAVVRGVAEYKTRMEVVAFLHGQLGPIRAMKVYEKYGDEARDKISKNPYRLIVDFEGFGFKLADAVARDVGVTFDDNTRLDAAITHVLAEGSKQGHTRVPINPLKARLLELLGDPELVERSLARTGEGEWSKAGDADDVYFELEKFRFLDHAIAKRIKELQAATPRLQNIASDLALPWVEQKLGLSYEDSQASAIAAALNEKVVVITGGPGVGKTTILNGLLKILRAKKAVVKLAAPTGRAAKRMAESTGFDAETIHRLLEYSPQERGFLRKRSNPLELDVLVVDEGSMLDLFLAWRLLDAMPLHGRLVLVGDRDQLPSVGAGQLLGDLIASGLVPVATLDKPFRQAGGSPIILNAHRINQGCMPVLDAVHDQFQMRVTQNASETADVVVDVVSNTLKDEGYDVVKDVMCLAPMRKGDAGVERVNLLLQQAINPAPVDSYERGGIRFGVGDKVTQQRNNRDLMVFNGDVGIIQHIDQVAKCLLIKFDQALVSYPFTETGSLALAYCTTVHKSQGSESPVVVVVVDRSQNVMLNRKLLYTAVTRAKNKVVLVGQVQAIHIAVSEARALERHTGLVEVLRKT